MRQQFNTNTVAVPKNEHNGLISYRLVLLVIIHRDYNRSHWFWFFNDATSYTLQGIDHFPS